MGNGQSSTSQGVREERRRDRRSAFSARPVSTIFEDLLRSNSQRSPPATANASPQPPLPPHTRDTHTTASGQSRYSTSSTRSRFFRSRTSFTNNIPSIFTRHSSSASVQQAHNESDSPTHQTLRRRSTEGNASTSPAEEDSGIAELDAFDTTLNELSGRPLLRTGASSGSTSRERHDSSDNTLPAPHRTFRSRTSQLRRRREELFTDGARLSEDSTAVLTRLLSITAAATAASLLGNNPDRAISRFRDAGGLGEDDDGAFDGFLRELSAGRIATALNQNQPGSPHAEGEGAARAPGSLDFFRMFRVGPSNAARRTAGGSTTPPVSNASHGERSQGHEERELNEDGTERRMVPILIVGIRSLNGSNATAPDVGNNMPSLFDAFGGLPPSINIGLENDGDAAGATTPPVPSGYRAQQRRRASMGGFGLLSRDRDPLRSSNRPLSEVRDSGYSDTTPPGPFPPPTTPASPPLSALSSRTLTPINSNRASVAGLPSLLGTRRESLGPQPVSLVGEDNNEDASRPSRAPRHRRLSESDFTRFGSGASRRNGVHLEPDTAATPEGNRSWVIYVLGGNYPENHPILSTPSLFTDSPSYEDMILLSTMLGPAKPPVASAEDVANAPGILRIGALDENLNIIAANGEDVVVIPADEQCQVCLSEYQLGEEARRLVKCSHIFHRECIDQWLTTGNNSCPLCRTKGVDEKVNEDSAAGEMAPVAASSEAVQ